MGFLNMNNYCDIRALTLSDLPTVLMWRNDPKVRQHMFTQHEVSQQEHLNWFKRVSLDKTKRVLVVEENSQLIGYVQFSNVTEGGVGDWGFYVRPGSPKGTGPKLAVKALDYAFDILKLHKVCGQVIEANAVSIAFHKSLGFCQEGILREQQRIESVYFSLFCFGLLSQEWKERKANER